MFAFSALFTTLFILQTQTRVLQLVDDGFLSNVFRPNSVFRLAVSASFRDEQKTISSYWGAVTILRRCRRNGIGKQFKVPILMVLSAIIYHIATVQISFRRVISTILFCVFCSSSFFR